MSDLQNPLFEEEKEFLERKKLEYERALRGDVDHIKDQSMAVGKIAAVGAGLAGGIWLITKAFGGKKKKKRNRFVADEEEYTDNASLPYRPEVDPEEEEQDEEFGATYFTAGNGKRYKSKVTPRSAADSAQAFMADHEQRHEDDYLGFGSTPDVQLGESSSPEADQHDHQPSPFDTEDFEDDPFQDMPYDDSRRLPASEAFDEEDGQASQAPSSRSNMLGSVLQAFLKTDTGKVLVAQAAAVALAMVTKKVSEFFPTAKNSDLATSPGYAPAETGAIPVASLASPDSPDASTHSQPL